MRNTIYVTFQLTILLCVHYCVTNKLDSIWAPTIDCETSSTNPCDIFAAVCPTGSVCVAKGCTYICVCQGEQVSPDCQSATPTSLTDPAPPPSNINGKRLDIIMGNGALNFLDSLLKESTSESSKPPTTKVSSTITAIPTTSTTTTLPTTTTTQPTTTISSSKPPISAIVISTPSSTSSNIFTSEQLTTLVASALKPLPLIQHIPEITKINSSTDHETTTRASIVITSKDSVTAVTSTPGTVTVQAAPSEISSYVVNAGISSPKPTTEVRSVPTSTVVASLSREPLAQQVPAVDANTTTIPITTVSSIAASVSKSVTQDVTRPSTFSSIITSTPAAPAKTISVDILGPSLGTVLVEQTTVVFPHIPWPSESPGPLETLGIETPFIPVLTTATTVESGNLDVTTKAITETTTAYASAGVTEKSVSPSVSHSAASPPMVASPGGRIESLTTMTQAISRGAEVSFEPARQMASTRNVLSVVPKVVIDQKLLTTYAAPGEVITSTPRSSKEPGVPIAGMSDRMTVVEHDGTPKVAAVMNVTKTTPETPQPTPTASETASIISSIVSELQQMTARMPHRFDSITSTTIKTKPWPTAPSREPEASPTHLITQPETTPISPKTTALPEADIKTISNTEKIQASLTTAPISTTELPTEMTTNQVETTPQFIRNRDRVIVSGAAPQDTLAAEKGKNKISRNKEHADAGDGGSSDYMTLLGDSLYMTIAPTTAAPSDSEKSKEDSAVNVTTAGQYHKSNQILPVIILKDIMPSLVAKPDPRKTSREDLNSRTLTPNNIDSGTFIKSDMIRKGKIVKKKSKISALASASEQKSSPESVPIRSLRETSPDTNGNSADILITDLMSAEKVVNSKEDVADESKTTTETNIYTRRKI